jgi:pyruvate dehydrogenase E1 component alpha subunit
MSDPAKYRTKEEVEEKKGRDPIINLKAMMMDKYGVSDDDLKQIDKDIKARVKEAADFAQESPELPPEELWTDILVEVE